MTDTREEMAAFKGTLASAGVTDLEAEATTPEALADPLKTAGKVAVAAALATTLAAGPVAPDKIHLPDPVPIVHVIDFGADQPAPDQPADQATDHRSVWKKIKKFILIALAALLTAAGIFFGAAKGCVGTLGAPGLDDDDHQTAQVETQEAVAAGTDTGVAADVDAAAA